jgi:hypothetical protein
MSTTVLIKPKGVRDENIGVLIVALITVLLAAIYIHFDREATTDTFVKADHQIDARYDLNPADQGLYADLLAATEEILWRIEDDEPIDLSSLADDLIPPFVMDAVSQERGGHQWSEHKTSSAWLFLGNTQASEVAGSFVAVIAVSDIATSNTATQHAHQHGTDDQDEAAPRVSIWYHQGEVTPFTQEADPSIETHLLAHDWKEVISHFDASVTRPGT